MVAGERCSEGTLRRQAAPVHPPAEAVGMVNRDSNLQESRLQPDQAFPAGTHRLKQLAW
jgi:hypothetical protein